MSESLLWRFLASLLRRPFRRHSKSAKLSSHAIKRSTCSELLVPTGCAILQAVFRSVVVAKLVPLR